MKGNFDGLLNSSFYQNLEQNFESFRLQVQPVDALATHDEKSRERILDAYVFSLQRSCRPRATSRDEQAQFVPLACAISIRIAAGNGNVRSVENRIEERRQNFRRVLQIRIDRSQQIRVRS